MARVLLKIRKIVNNTVEPPSLPVGILRVESGSLPCPAQPPGSLTRPRRCRAGIAEVWAMSAQPAAYLARKTKPV
jgi:hypothetical protein